MNKNWSVYKNGEKENFTVEVDGKKFFCECGANVFQKYKIDNKEIYVCNGCKIEYKAT